jgi:hypothetical protein
VVYKGVVDLIEILVPNENDSIVNIALEGKKYSLHFAWNSIGEFWTLEIMDDAGNSLVCSIKMVSNYPLLNQYKNHKFPPGEFMVVSDTTERPGREDFENGSAVFMYVESGEIDALQS